MVLDVPVNVNDTSTKWWTPGSSWVLICLLLLLKSSFENSKLQLELKLNSLCYTHTAGLPWTCGLKSTDFSKRGVTQEVHLYFLSDAHTWSASLDMWLEVCKYVPFKWWRHSASTYDVWSVGWDNQFSQPKITEKGSQIHRKCSENRFLGPPGDPLESLWSLLRSILEHMCPKNWILKALGRVLGAQDVQFGSNLEAQGFQNGGHDVKKSMLKNNMFLTSILKGFGPRFGRVFDRFFWAKTHTKSETPNCVTS